MFPRMGASWLTGAITKILKVHGLRRHTLN